MGAHLERRMSLPFLHAQRTLGWPQVPPDIHGLMQDADHEDRVVTDLVEDNMAPRDQSAGAMHKVGAIHPHPRVFDEAVQGTVDVIKIAVRLIGAPLLK